MNPRVDFYFDKDSRWQKELEKLRSLILACGLEEKLKWGTPCYTWNNANIVLLHMFRDYCAMLFFKGALMNDPKGILIQQTKNVQSARQIRFTSLEQITKQQKLLKAYIYEAIEVEKAGLKVDLKKTSEYSIPEEFQKKLKKHPKLQKAFDSLTPGRQRGYILYFSAAKQTRTRESRIEKYMPLILEGKGLNDE